MALDGIFLNHIKNEISPLIIGSRVEKIHQPSREELVIHLRSRSGAYKLFLSVRANSPRVHLTEYAPENPATPPMFCMLMRKKLSNALLKDIRQPELDRVLYFDFEGINDIGDRVTLTLSIEIMSKHSNIILSDENGRIVDAIRRIDFSRSEVRQILPGFPYTPPPAQEKLNILTCLAEEILLRIKLYENKSVSSALLNSVQGLSPLICRETAFNCGDDITVCDMNTAYEEKLKIEIEKLKQTVTAAQGTPYIIKDENGNPCDFAFLRINQYGSARINEAKNSFSQLLDAFYWEKDAVERTRQKSRELIKLVHNLIERTSRKINLQRAELQQCADRENLRINAELINANLYNLEKGALFYDLPNYYDNNNILRIKADPALSPAANAQKYFKLYRKAKNAEQMLTELISKNEEELQYLDSVSDALDRASGQAETDEIKSELILSGYIKSKNSDKKKQQKISKPFEYITSDGFRVMVGKNNLQNDRLTFKIAQKNDMWLHTQKIHGSHVIIFSDNREISDKAIVEAAEIAAFHSKANEAKLVPVDYTYVKNIKKPPSAPPGKVIYHVYYSVNVTPDKDIIEKKIVKK